MSLTPHQIKTIAEDRFEAACKELQTDCYFHRLFDTSDIRQRSKTESGVRSYAHLPKNPSDYVVTVKGRMFYAEVKGTAADRFAFSHIEPSQLAAMIQQLRAGGEYCVFINQVIDGEWFLIPGRIFVDNHQNGSPIKSISFNNIRKDYGLGKHTNPLSIFA